MQTLVWSTIRPTAFVPDVIAQVHRELPDAEVRGGTLLGEPVPVGIATAIRGILHPPRAVGAVDFELTAPRPIRCTVALIGIIRSVWAGPIKYLARLDRTVAAPVVIRNGHIETRDRGSAEFIRTDSEWTPPARRLLRDRLRTPYGGWAVEPLIALLPDSMGAIMAVVTVVEEGNRKHGRTLALPDLLELVDAMDSVLERGGQPAAQIRGAVPTQASLEITGTGIPWFEGPQPG